VGGPASSEEAREPGRERGRMSATAIDSSTEKLKEADVTNRTGQMAISRSSACGWSTSRVAEAWIAVIGRGGGAVVQWHKNEAARGLLRLRYAAGASWGECEATSPAPGTVM
jgi:anti-sigma factor RsiW